MRAARIVVAVAVVGVLIALGVGLARAGARSAGTNSINPVAFVAVVPPGGRACQDGEAVPPDAAALAVDAGSYGRPGPPLRVTIGPGTGGARPGGYPDGWVAVPLSGRLARSDRFAGGVVVCVENRGAARVALAGLPLPQSVATVNGRPWSMASTVAGRATVGKADLGKWTPVVALVLLWAGALTLVLRRTGQ
jgi:hypothetical protein